MIARLKKYALWFSVGSLLLFTASFFLKNASQLLFVSQVLCARSVAAKQGVGTLLVKDSLKPGDAGFDALSSIVIANTTNSGMVAIPVIQEFRFEAMIGFAEHGPAQTSGQVTIDFSNGQSLQCQAKFLDDMVQKAFDLRILFWSSVFFTLGLVDGICGLFLKYSPQKKPVSESHKERVEVAHDSTQKAEQTCALKYGIPKWLKISPLRA